MWGDAPFPCEINEMGEDVAGGGADQGGRHLGVDSGGEVIGGGGAGAQGGEDFGLAGLAVGDEPVEAGGGVGNRGAVAGMEDAPRAAAQPGAGGHEIGQIAIGGRDQR